MQLLRTPCGHTCGSLACISSMIHQSSVYLPPADDEAPTAPARAVCLRAGQAKGARAVN